MVRIGIIGGGSSGATATKACLEEGFDVVVYEKTDFTGGLWRYHDDDVSGIASVSRSTIINSSKEMSAFSDFPPPEHFPNYMHNTKMVEYIDMYADSFAFRKYVKFNHEIVNCKPAADYEATGRWTLTIKDVKNNRQFDETFDGVMICTGHHTVPSVPTFPGQEKFRGQVLHSHSYKKPDSFENKRVVVVGIGNSGGDAVVELSMVTKDLYLSTRRGTWIVHRVGPNGRPFDQTFLRRFLNMFMTKLPYDVVCTFAEWFINSRVDHSRYQLKPDHRILSQHIFVNDALPNRILSGTVVVKPNVERFTETGVVFEGEKQETPCDAVLLATGYKVEFPFISKELIPTYKNQVDLYKYVFSPKLAHPKTLAFIALAQPIGALFPIAEIQSRWYALLMANKLQLPSRAAMEEDIERKRKEMAHRYSQSERHTVQVDWIPFMDELAELIGARPNLMKYAMTDPKLWLSLMFGPCVPYQYRLNGPHPWPKAREAILGVYQRIEAPLKTRLSDEKRMGDDKLIRLDLTSLLVAAFIFVFIAYFLLIMF